MSQKEIGTRMAKFVGSNGRVILSLVFVFSLMAGLAIWRSEQVFGSSVWSSEVWSSSFSWPSLAWETAKAGSPNIISDGYFTLAVESIRHAADAELFAIRT